MALRLIRAYVASRDAMAELEIRGIAGVDLLSVEDREDCSVLEILAPSESTENVVTVLEKHHGSPDGFRVLIWKLAATIPTEIARETNASDDGDEDASPPVNVEELYEEVNSEVGLDSLHAVSVAIAAIVAAAGLITDSTELVVGSMILAPLLGPSMALSVATALGDMQLGRRALIVNAIGIAVAIAVGAAMGAAFGLPLDNAHVASRTTIGVLDFIVAGTAGAAGALSYTSGAFGRIVGVMIAVALLPPLVLTGMHIGTLNFRWAVGPALLSLVNLIGINLAGVLVLYVQRIRPRPQWGQRKARKAVFVSLGAWTIMLAVLAAIAILARDYLAGL